MTVQLHSTKDHNGVGWHGNEHLLADLDRVLLKSAPVEPCCQGRTDIYTNPDSACLGAD
jgi:hypothetical protein